MLEKIVIGWENIEDVFLANLALKRPFVLMGKHGICKTTVAKQISKMYQNDDESHFRFYDATKDDLISIAGIPIPEKLKEGKLEFSHHDRTIWGAKIVVVDEISRAGKENSNLWLEILEEKTCFGKKLQYETFIATMNPETYASTFKMDEALMDRFYAIIPVPDFQKAGAKKFEEVIRLNFEARKNGYELPEIKETMESIQKNYKTLRSDEEFSNGVVEFVARFLEVLLSQQGSGGNPDVNFYVSPRKSIQIPEEIFGICATQMVLKNEPLNKAMVENSAFKALIYTVCIPLQLDEQALKQLFEKLKPLLFRFKMSEADRIRLKLSECNKEGVYRFFLEKHSDIQKHLKADEVEKLVGEQADYTKTRGSEILNFYGALAGMNALDEWKKRIMAQILFAVQQRLAVFRDQTFKRSAIASTEDGVMVGNLKRFFEFFKTMPFPEGATKFVLDEIPENTWGHDPEFKQLPEKFAEFMEKRAK